MYAGAICHIRPVMDGSFLETMRDSVMTLVPLVQLSYAPKHRTCQVLGLHALQTLQ